LYAAARDGIAAFSCGPTARRLAWRIYTSASSRMDLRRRELATLARRGIQTNVTTEIEERRIDAVELRVGMYICRLDRPWEGTPFPLQGFEVRDENDIRTVREWSRHVYIDALRDLSRDPSRKILKAPVTGWHLRRASTMPSALRFDRVRNYADSQTVAEELPRARAALQTAVDNLERIYKDIAAGRDFNADDVEQAVRPLVASVLRRADAFLFLEGMRSHDTYSYTHALNCSALAAVFGRHMGLQEETIISLAAGGLLMDIGKTRVAERLLQAPRSLSEDEMHEVRQHVDHGLALLRQAAIQDVDVIDVISTHHERHNGTGYPHGLFEAGIPIAGRMLGIIDSYDAMSSARPYRPGLSRHHALQQIYAARDTLFQSELVEQFQVCLSVYPTGSLVELTSGEVAVVMMQNQARRLKPRVLVLTTPDKKPLPDFMPVDLLIQGDQEPSRSIVRGLAAGEFSIDTSGYLSA
jgi:HD-GYP domain-containing protein (c-di-GMP phosphodiesterase class II)